VYEASVLDLEQSDLIAMFGQAVARLAAVSFEIGEINAATVPHSFGRAFNTLIAIAMQADYEFAELKEIKEMIANGGSAAASGDAGADAGAADAAAEESDEEEAAPAMDMFGDDDGGEEDY